MLANVSADSLSTQLGLAAAAGVVAHLTYFIRGEHHTESVRYAQLLVLVPVVAAYLLFSFVYHDALRAAGSAYAMTGAFLAGTFGSMILYRAGFHRLRRYPGPFMWRISKLWHMFQLSGLDNFKQLDKLHKQYGEYVRVGPCELSITDPEAVEPILGPRSRCYKAAWYDLSLPLVSMHNARDKAVHDKRRRTWDKGFNAKSLRNYESRVTGYAHRFLDQIRAFSGKAVNVTQWFNYYSFDVMGELAFGKSFDMLSSGKEHFAIQLLHEGTVPIGLFTPVPWLFIILSKIPFLSAGFKRFLKFCDDQVENRKRNKPTEPDIMSYLLDSEPMGDEAHNKLWLTGDSRLIIVAGSDTTAATLTHVFYNLCKDPSQFDKLRQELDPIMASQTEETFNVSTVQTCEHLNGVINEALRLHPPVPSGVLRMTPPEGIQIGEHYIPPEVTIGIPMHSLNRSPKIYERPEEFIPERWYSKQNMVKYPKAFAPFSIGPYGCIGKQLALMELRTMITLIVTQFDVSFAPKEDGSALVNNVQDIFTVSLADLKLQFAQRK